MCPDRDLVSAYVDGEVPSPWRERIEEHLGSCPNCAALAEGYRELGEKLRADALYDEDAMLERGRARLEAMLGAAPTQAFLRRRASAGTWERRVSLPLPIAAAAAALVLLLGGATTLLALRPSKTPTIQTVASSDYVPLPAAQTKSQPANMDELLRYLGQSDAQVTLTIKLPSGTTFGSAGNPVIMRSSQAPRALQATPNVMPVGGKTP